MFKTPNQIPHSMDRPIDAMAATLRNGAQPNNIMNVKAGEILDNICHDLRDNGYSDEDMAYFITRLTFCFFADDAGLFKQRGMMHEYLSNSKKDGSDLGDKIWWLFATLCTPINKRKGKEKNSEFPYINSALFKGVYKSITFNGIMRQRILEASKFNWSLLMPFDFGIILRDTFNHYDHFGMHVDFPSYQYVLNSIESMFLKDLKDEFNFIRAKNNRELLLAFQDKLANLKFYNPTCGIGNFLVVTYHEIRELEFNVIEAIWNTGFDYSKIRTNMGQFYGIDIDPMSANISQITLCMEDCLLNKAFVKHFSGDGMILPIHHVPTIKHGNELDLGWEKILLSGQCSYAFGSPPFTKVVWNLADQKKSIEKSIGMPIREYLHKWYDSAQQYDTSPAKCFMPY